MVKDLDMPKDARAKAIREFRKLPSDKPENQEKEEQRWRRAEIIIVCDMLLTGFDAPIVQTMYLDKGLRNHTLLQAIARVNRPYNELKKEGVHSRLLGGVPVTLTKRFATINPNWVK